MNPNKDSYKEKYLAINQKIQLHSLLYQKKKLKLKFKLMSFKNNKKNISILLKNIYNYCVDKKNKSKK